MNLLPTKTPSKKRKVSEAELTECCRFYAAQRDEGVSRVDAFAAVVRLGFPNTLHSLECQLQKFKRDGHAVLVEKRTGRKPTLDADQEEKIKDFVRAKNVQNEPIALRDVRKFVLDEYGYEYSDPSCSRLMHRLGMTNKKCRTKSAGFKYSTDERLDMYWKYILDLRAKWKIYKEPSLLASIDTTFTSEAKRDERSWSDRGSAPLVSKNTSLKRTNAVVTMPYADGINHMPCHMWTSDSRCALLTLDRVPTARRQKLHAEFLATCEEFEIDPSRVHYCKDGGMYIGETSEMYMEFLADVDRNVTVFHDGGRSFKKDGQSIFDLMGFKHHETYPSAVHQFLSPNDFHLHGVKSTWRGEYPKFADDVSATLRLMQLIDCDTVANSKKYFMNNLLRVKKSHIAHVVGATSLV
jgi:transposase